MRRNGSIRWLSLAGLGLSASALIVVASAAAPGRKTTAGPPRIVAAAMLDVNRDARADTLRLTYSVPIRHRLDRDGRYPFTVAGYRIRSVGAAAGRQLEIRLREHARPDEKARPAVRYRRTRSQPVLARTGVQAVPELFRRVLPSGRGAAPVSVAATPPATKTATTTTTSPAAPTALDSDHDGTPDGRDCAPKDPAIHPGATDLPDLKFVDSNCDGVDGTVADAVFVSPSGNDGNPGTMDKPKREIQAGIDAATMLGRHEVLVAAGDYGRFQVAGGVGVYGGYDPGNWSRRKATPTSTATGSPEAVLATNAKDVVLQLLGLHGAFTTTDVGGESSYGIFASASDLTLQRVAVSAGPGIRGRDNLIGSLGGPGGAGGAGERGADGLCDTVATVLGGLGGPSPSFDLGGPGGRGGAGDANGQAGTAGVGGTAGGDGGLKGVSGTDPGSTGLVGHDGAAGTQGAPGEGATNSLAHAAYGWYGEPGSAGARGGNGSGGGGGGGGGGQPDYSIVVKVDWPGTRPGGGGGGGGGQGGAGGRGGGPGGGSFGIYLFNAHVTADADTTIGAGSGAPGGAGEQGYAGGAGGGGGGGAGGPSIGIFKEGASSATLDGTTIAPGAGGAGGKGGAPNGRPGQDGLALEVAG